MVVRKMIETRKNQHASSCGQVFSMVALFVWWYVFFGNFVVFIHVSWCFLLVSWELTSFLYLIWAGLITSNSILSMVYTIDHDHSKQQVNHRGVAILYIVNIVSKNDGNSTFCWSVQWWSKGLQRLFFLQVNSLELLLLWLILIWW